MLGRKSYQDQIRIYNTMKGKDYMENLICIEGTTLTRKFYDRQIVLTFSDIDTYHKRVDGTAKDNFIRNKSYFKEHIDYFIVKRKELGDKMTAVYGFNPKAPSGTLLTKSGYLMIVKSMNDPTAWEQHRKLVNTYFLAEQLVAEKQQEANTLMVPADQTENLPAEAREMLQDFLKSQNTMLEEEFKRNEIFRDTMKKSFSMMAKVILNQVDILNKIIQYPGSIVEVRPEETKRPGTVKATEKNKEQWQIPYTISRYELEYREYRDDMGDILKEIVKLDHHYRDEKAVLSDAYKKLTKQYGLCYTQYQKEFFEETGRKARSMMELFFWMEHKNPSMKNILRTKLETLLENSKKLKDEKHEKRINTNGVSFPPVSLEELERLVKYIWEFYGKGNTTAVVWHKFFRRLDKDYKLDWEGRRDIYRKVRGMKPTRIVSKVEILRNNKDMARCAYDYANINMDQIFPEAIDYLRREKGMV